MPSRTSIEWCDYSSNALRAEHNGKKGWQCAKVSPGCLNCYSETIDGRFGLGLGYTTANARKATHYVDEKELRHMLAFRPKGPFKGGATRPRVFVGDMTDIFGDWNSDETLDRLFAAFALRSDVDWQVLTKRAERMHKYLSRHDVGLRWWRLMPITNRPAIIEVPQHWTANGLPNVWCGVSAEDQQRADERIPWLLKTPAAVRFISAEPLLGPIDLRQAHVTKERLPNWPNATRVGLCIVGGESGHGARECDLAWIRSIVDQCKAAGVACFVKQVGSNPRDVSGNRGPNAGPFRVKHSKGGDPAEWPESLRVREFPSVEVPTP